MKRISILVVVLMVGSIASYAQWNPNGTHIYNTNTGNVGIGTSTPAGKLHVNGVGYFGNENANASYRVSIGGSGTNYGSIGSGYKYSTTDFQHTYALTDYASQIRFDLGGFNFLTAPVGTAGNPVAFTSAMNILQNGNVGIGTTSPATLLNINQGAGDATIGTGSLRIGGTSNYPSLEFGIKGAYDGMISTYGNDLHIYAGNWRSVGAMASENHNISFYTSQASSTNWNTPKMYLRYDGNVGIGTANPNQKLTVNGTIYSKEVKVDLSVPGPDYVFEENYNLPSLTDTENYIKQNKHLPEMPSACEMEEKGINLSEMNMLLLKKVEELTLHLLKQEKTIAEQNQRLLKLENKE